MLACLSNQLTTNRPSVTSQAEEHFILPYLEGFQVTASFSSLRQSRSRILGYYIRAEGEVRSPVLLCVTFEEVYPADKLEVALRL